MNMKKINFKTYGPHFVLCVRAYMCARAIKIIFLLINYIDMNIINYININTSLSIMNEKKVYNIIIIIK